MKLIESFLQADVVEGHIYGIAVLAREAPPRNSEGTDSTRMQIIKAAIGRWLSRPFCDQSHEQLLPCPRSQRLKFRIS